MEMLMILGMKKQCTPEFIITIRHAMICQPLLLTTK